MGKKKNNTFLVVFPGKEAQNKSSDQLITIKKRSQSNQNSVTTPITEQLQVWVHYHLTIHIHFLPKLSSALLVLKFCSVNRLFQLFYLLILATIMNQVVLHNSPQYYINQQSYWKSKIFLLNCLWIDLNCSFCCEECYSARSHRQDLGQELWQITRRVDRLTVLIIT